jgi:hypothetical protein
MLYIPSKGILRADDHNLGSVGTTTPGTSVTTGGTSATKGTAVQLTASTLYDAYWIRVYAWGYSNLANAAGACLDILIGAATEEVLIPNLLAGNAATLGLLGLGCGKSWDFPIYIPAGSRLAAQAAGERTSTAMRVGYQLFGGKGSPMHPVGTKVTTYGIGTVPAGTAVTAGVSGAEGSFTQITASTSENHIAIVPSWQNRTDTTLTSQVVSLDVGIGAATEDVESGPYMYSVDANEAMAGPFGGCMPIFDHIPSGTRLSVRASTSVATNDTSNEAALHCVS